MLAELIVPTARTTTFAWYNFVGYLATALGSAEAGRLVDFLQLTQHWTPVESCRAVFVQYSIVGAALIAILVTGLFRRRLSLHISERPVIEEPLLQPLNTVAESTAEQPSNPSTCEPSLPSEDSEECNQMLGISPQSVHTMMHLSSLFAIDSFAGSLVTGKRFGLLVCHVSPEQ